jgi:hypothetical protein
MKGYFKMDIKEIGCDDTDWIREAQEGTVGFLLWKRKWIFGSHKRHGNA